MHPFPPPAFHVARCRACVVIPLVVVPVDPAVGPRHPRQVRVGIGERPEQMLALPQFMRHTRAFDRLPGATRDPLHEFDFARFPCSRADRMHGHCGDEPPLFLNRYADHRANVGHLVRCTIRGRNPWIEVAVGHDVRLAGPHQSETFFAKLPERIAADDAVDAVR